MSLSSISVQINYRHEVQKGDFNDIVSYRYVPDVTSWEDDDVCTFQKK